MLNNQKGYVKQATDMWSFMAVPPHSPFLSFMLLLLFYMERKNRKRIVCPCYSILNSLEDTFRTLLSFYHSPPLYPSRFHLPF